MMNTDQSAILRVFEEYNEKRGDEFIFVRTDEPMSRHTTFRIGGPAALFIGVKDVDSLKYVLKYLNESEIRVFVLGRGSNVLFADKGFDGAVVSTTMLDGITVDGTELTAGSGALVSNVAKKALESSLAGMEFLYGIPGTCGGAVFMNAGAYGGETAMILKESSYLDLDDYQVKTLTNEDHEFGYRRSVFRKSSSIAESLIRWIAGPERTGWVQQA